jgi:hypothetical protein
MSLLTVTIGLLYWRQRFTKHRRWYVPALVISAGFLIADIGFPTEETKPSEVVYQGKYSDFPCEKGQTFSQIDHRPCKPVFDHTNANHQSPILGAQRPIETQKKMAPVSYAVTQNQFKTQPATVLESATKSASAARISDRIFNVDPMVGYGEIKLFMGTECSWNNVIAESKRKAIETGVLDGHTFMISPSNETCYLEPTSGRILSKWSCAWRADHPK